MAAKKRAKKAKAPSKSKKKTKTSKIKKVKKTSKKKSKKQAKSTKPKLPKNAVGIVTHYFPHVNAAVVKILKPLSAGDEVELTGHTTKFKQRIESMQIDHVPIQKAKKGDEIGLRVKSRVREHDIMTLVGS